MITGFEKPKDLQPLKIDGSLSVLSERGLTSIIYKIDSGSKKSNILRVAKTPNDDRIITRHHEVLASFNGFLQPRVAHIAKPIGFGLYNGRVADIETFVQGALGNIKEGLLLNKISDRADFLSKAIAFFERIYQKKGFIIAGDIKLNDFVLDGSEVGYIDFGTAQQTRTLETKDIEKSWDKFMDRYNGLMNVARELSPRDPVPSFLNYPKTFKGVKEWADTIRF